MVCTMMTQTPLAAPTSFARGTRPSASPYSLRCINRRFVAARAEKGPIEQIEEATQVGKAFVLVIFACA